MSDCFDTHDSFSIGTGSARFASPLNVWDFVHIISLIALNPATTTQIAPLAARIARTEGLEGHARSADYRVESEK